MTRFRTAWQALAAMPLNLTDAHGCYRQAPDKTEYPDLFFFRDAACPFSA
jgi:hypothetical protein